MNNQPTFVDNLMKPKDPSQMMSQSSAMPIDSEQCREWARILRKYKSGKSLLENRMKSNQQYWRGKHWREIREKIPDQPEPSSAWITNVILAKHAARMDAYPEATVLPREEMDDPQAQLLTSIIPCILDMCDFRKTYSQVGWDKEISCAGAYCITWDQSKHNGLGDIDIAPVDLMNLYWEPGITDIQQSKYVFVVKLVDTDILAEQYPDKVFNKGGGRLIEPTQYVYEDNVDTTEKDCVIDVYYKKNVEGKTILHYAKFVRDILLFSTENDPQLSVTGLYNHGMYPFVIEPMYPVKGSIAGFGYVDMCRDPQDYIDILGSAIMKNSMENATPRYFIRSDAGINIQQFNNLNERLIECSGNLAEDAVRPVDNTEFPSAAIDFYQLKIEEMKQTAGNRDASSGGTEGGVTAASALAVMQEAGNSLSRDENGIAYDAFKQIVKFIIELIRQFYDLPRFFRIEGERGAVQFVTYTNHDLQEQMSIGMSGEQYFRKPEFDLDVQTAQDSDYSVQSQNNLALQFYSAGFFNPANAMMVLPCLDMMEFKGKDKMYRAIQQNAVLFQQAMMASPAPTEGEGGGSQPQGKADAEKRAEQKKADAKSQNVAGVTPQS